MGTVLILVPSRLMRLVERFERPPGCCMACGNIALPAVDLDVSTHPGLSGGIEMGAYLCRTCCLEVGRMFGLEPVKDTSEADAKIADLEKWVAHWERTVEAREKELERVTDMVPKRRADETRRKAVAQAKRNERTQVINEIHEMAGTTPPIKDDIKQIEHFAERAKDPAVA